MSDQFYRAFEDRFRGSRSTIHSRLTVYRPFLSLLRRAFPNDAQGLDLGCGRGEWLEILQLEGIEPLGVDMDEGMLEACRALKLPTIKGDAIAYLAGLPNESLAVISAFHLVEHITFPQLQHLVAEAHRVLKPGGLLVMETPNPENIEVGTSHFYLDPTHQQPIPHQLLSFLPEHTGFARTKVLRLQESPTLLQKHALGLHDVFTGSSPDYAVIAQKAAPLGVLEAFDSEFQREHGMSLAALSSHYDSGIQAPIKRTADRLRNAESDFNEKFNQLQLSQQTLEKQLQDHIHIQFHQMGLEVQGLHQGLREVLRIQGQISGAEQASIHSKLKHAEQRAHEAEQQLFVAMQTLTALRSSTYWRLLSPIRWLTIQLKLVLTQGPVARARALGRKIHPDSSPLEEASKPAIKPEHLAHVEEGPSTQAESKPTAVPQPASVKAPDAALASAPPEQPVSTRVETIYKKLKGSTNQTDD